MAVDFEVTEDNSDEIIRQLGNQVERALEQCGIRAEELAVGMCPVDTGLLRNSITYAMDGEAPKKGAYKADRGDGHGEYAGAAPKEGGKSRAVFIGSNVEYAPYIELGSSKRPAKPFLKPAISEHQADYKEIIERNLKS